MACALFDLKQRRLPNMLTLGMHVLAVAILVITGQGLLGDTISASLMGWLVALMLTVPAYALNWLGAGDAKFLAAIGLLAGLKFLLVSYLLAGLMAGIIIFLWLSAQRYSPYINLHLAPFNLRLPTLPLLRGKVLPFGAIIAFSAIITVVLYPSLETAL